MSAVLAVSEDAEIIKSWALFIMAVTGLIVGPMIVWRARKLSADLRGLKVSYDTQTTKVTAAATAATTAAAATAVAAATNAQKLEAVAAEVSEINTAVNRKQPHEPTLVKRVAKLEHTVDTEVVPAVRHLVKTTQHRLEWERQMGEKLGIQINVQEDPR